MSLLIVFSFALLSFGIVQNVEARGPDEPCSYLKPHLWTRDASGNCIRTSVVPETSNSPVTSRSVNEPCSYLNPTKYVRDPQTGLCHKVIVNTPAPQTTTTQTNDFRIAPTTTTPVTTAILDIPTIVIPEINNVTESTDETIQTLTDETIQTLFVIGTSIILGLIIYKKWKRSRNRNSGDQLLTFEQIQRIRNIQAKFEEARDEDPDLILVEFNAKLKNYSKRGNELYETKTIIPNRTLKILKYVDPSTGRIYISFVPDEMKDADEAMAWKFSITKREYHNMVDEG